MIIDEDIYLEHYGVKGMKWGVRKDRRAANKQARREKNVKKYLDKAKVFDTKIKELENTSYSKYSLKRGRDRDKIIGLQVKRRQAILDAKAKSEGKLTDKQKTVLKGAALVTAIVGAGVLYSTLQSGEANRLMNKGKDFFKDKHDPGWKLDRSLADPMTEDAIMAKVVSKINPGYGDIGTKVNCRRATWAYEMRRRGYDVAATKTTTGYGQTVVGNYNAMTTKKENLPTGAVTGAKRIAEEALGRKPKTLTPLLNNAANQLYEKPVLPGRIFKDMPVKLPPNSRGELGMIWKAGGGHSMAWEMVGDKLVIFDTQNGKKYSTAAEIAEVASNMKDVGFTRLDNKTIDTDYLMRWVKDA